MAPTTTGMLYQLRGWKHGHVLNCVLLNDTVPSHSLTTLSFMSLTVSSSTTQSRVTLSPHSVPASCGTADWVAFERRQPYCLNYKLIRLQITCFYFFKTLNLYLDLPCLKQVFIVFFTNRITRTPVRTFSVKTERLLHCPYCISLGVR